MGMDIDVVFIHIIMQIKKKFNLFEKYIKQDCTKNVCQCWKPISEFHKRSKSPSQPIATRWIGQSKCLELSLEMFQNPTVDAKQAV